MTFQSCECSDIHGTILQILRQPHKGLLPSHYSLCLSPGNTTSLRSFTLMGFWTVVAPNPRQAEIHVWKQNLITYPSIYVLTGTNRIPPVLQTKVAFSLSAYNKSNKRKMAYNKSNPFMVTASAFLSYFPAASCQTVLVPILHSPIWEELSPFKVTNRLMKCSYWQGEDIRPGVQNRTMHLWGWKKIHWGQGRESVHNMHPCTYNNMHTCTWGNFPEGLFFWGEMNEKRRNHRPKSGHPLAPCQVCPSPTTANP